MENDVALGSHDNKHLKTETFSKPVFSSFGNFKTNIYPVTSTLIFLSQYFLCRLHSIGGQIKWTIDQPTSNNDVCRVLHEGALNEIKFVFVNWMICGLIEWTPFRQD